MSPNEAFHAQAEHCANLGSPFTARLMTLAGDRLTDATPVGQHILNWPGNASHRADAVPLRLAGALHALARSGHAGLQQVYPPNHETISDDALWAAVETSLNSDASFILNWMKSPPQTNEVRRLNALYPGLLAVAAETGLPLVTSEIGASAGLNMRWDRYAYDLGGKTYGDPASAVRLNPEWRGNPAPDAVIESRAKAGCDINPLDPTDPATQERLMCYIWPDQFDRMERTEAAIAIAAADGQKVEKADAIDWLTTRLATRDDSAAHVIYHSIAWQYLPEAAQAKGAAMIAKAGEQATAETPLAWLQMEGDGLSPGAAITLTLWPTGETRLLGRADFHGRWVEWQGWS